VFDIFVSVKEHIMGDAKQLAIWDVNKTAEMTPEANLRNVCRQLEDEYITWSRFVSLVSGIQWPAIGELGRYSTEGVRITFIKHRRYVDVMDADRKQIGRVPVHAGMAVDLYVLAGAALDATA
jgi:hypothetical protein